MKKLIVSYRKTSDLNPYANNAMAHPESQVQALMAGIKQFGFTNPILVDAKNEIIAGHGRLIAALRLGLKEVPCIELGYLSEAQKRAYRIADNKVSRKSVWDMDLLTKELQDLADMDLDFDLALTGFEQGELDSMLKDLGRDLGFEQDDQDDESPDEFDDDSEETEGEAETATDEAAKEEEPKFPAPTPRSEPKASGEKHSLFELVMLHENKVQLLDTLNEIKTSAGFEKLEEALMELVRIYNDRS